MQINYSKENTLFINEIFYSIQGESTHIGRPCVFVRLTYCNLRCTYCDTEYAFEEGQEMSITEIIEKITNYRCNLVEITGGEPLLQNNVHLLMKQLCDLGFEVLLETGGSLDISKVDTRVKKILDFKCPDSGMEKKNLWENVNLLGPNDEVKFVVCSKEDFDWSIEKIREYNLISKCTILISPVINKKFKLDYKDLARWILETKLPIRMQVQLHKIIWGKDARGV